MVIISARRRQKFLKVGSVELAYFLLSEGANAPLDFAEGGFSVAVQQGAFLYVTPKTQNRPYFYRINLN